jgi:hypothetical protein
MQPVALFLLFLMQGMMQSQGFMHTHPYQTNYDSVRPNMSWSQPLHLFFGHMMMPAAHTSAMHQNPGIPSWQQQQTAPSFINLSNPVQSAAQLQNTTCRPEQHGLTCVVHVTKAQAATFLMRAKNVQQIGSTHKNCHNPLAS